MARKRKPRVDLQDPKNAIVVKLAAQVRKEVRKRHGTDLTYEQRRDAAASVMGEVLWADEESDLHELVTEDDEVVIAGTRYRRLEQASSAAYYGRWGPHEVKEPLYREVGVRNGRTVKPIEHVVGMIARHVTPDLARIVGQLSAHCNSREVATILGAVGLVAPSRSFLEKRITEMVGEMASEIECLEQEARAEIPAPPEIASVSCGMDRMAIRMSEPSDPDTAPRPLRTKPYQRKPPPPKENHWRMGWVGSTTAYNAQGDPLHTWRYAAEASADDDEIAHRVGADVAWLVRQNPSLVVQCIQDAAPELDVLPASLAKILPANTNVAELIDFEHLMGYLDKVVDACEAEGDPYNWKRWYRAELLSDDSAIDTIWRRLRRLGRRLPRGANAADATTRQAPWTAVGNSWVTRHSEHPRHCFV